VLPVLPCGLVCVLEGFTLFHVRPHPIILLANERRYLGGDEKIVVATDLGLMRFSYLGRKVAAR